MCRRLDIQNGQGLTKLLLLHLLLFLLLLKPVQHALVLPFLTNSLTGIFLFKPYLPRVYRFASFPILSSLDNNNYWLSFPFFSISGENKHFGAPTNPAVPARVPGGSSSGAAVSVAANFVDFSLGQFLRIFLINTPLLFYFSIWHVHSCISRWLPVNYDFRWFLPIFQRITYYLFVYWLQPSFHSFTMDFN